MKSLFLLLGVSCLLLALAKVSRFAGKVPPSLIHGLQAALGVLLISQGLKYGLGENFFSDHLVMLCVLVALFLGLLRKVSFPRVSNAIIGFTLLVLAVEFFPGSHLRLPPLLLGGLLATTGIIHLELAAPTWAFGTGKLKLITMGLVAVATQNMLWVAGAGLLAEGIHAWLRSKTHRRVILPKEAA